MTKLEVLKSTVSFAVGAGVGQIVSGIVDNNVPQETIFQKVFVFAGKTGITMVAGEVVKNHVSSKIDLAAEWVSDNVTN